MAPYQLPAWLQPVSWSNRESPSHTSLIFSHKLKFFGLKTPFPHPPGRPSSPEGMILVCWFLGLLQGSLLEDTVGKQPLLGDMVGKGKCGVCRARLFGIWNNASSFYLLSSPARFSLSCAEIPAAPPTTAASSTEEPAGTLSLLLKHLDGKCLLSNCLLKI